MKDANTKRQLIKIFKKLNKDVMKRVTSQTVSTIATETAEYSLTDP